MVPHGFPHYHETNPTWQGEASLVEFICTYKNNIVIKCQENYSSTALEEVMEISRLAIGSEIYLKITVNYGAVCIGLCIVMVLGA